MYLALKPVSIVATSRRRKKLMKLKWKVKITSFFSDFKSLQHYLLGLTEKQRARVDQSDCSICYEYVYIRF